MKKFLLVAAIIVIGLFIIDITILQDDGLVEKSTNGNTYERYEDPDALPLGLDLEERAPSFTLTTLDGKTVTLEDYKGKKILLNFWATWCPPCKAEMPDMQQMYEEHKNEDFVVLAVNVTVTEKKAEDVSAFVEEYGLTFPILMDEKGKVAHQFEILSYPTSYFIDSDGVIRGKVIGALSKESMYKEMSLLP
jgi:peroxiredoxin